MGVAERQQRAGFSLSFEPGGGRLELTHRKVGPLLTISKLVLSLDELPRRFEINTEGDRFRHQRARLDELILHVEDQTLGARFCAPPLRDLEIRAIDDELLLLGALEGEAPQAEGAGRPHDPHRAPPSPGLPGGVPFLARARLEPAHAHDPASLLLSFYELRLYGPAPLSAPQLGALLLETLGFERQQIGPTAALFAPIDQLLLEICAELGWKLPRRDKVRLDEVRLRGGRLELIAGRPRGHLSQHKPSGAARQERFLVDYEAKRHYAAIEEEIAEGRLARATVSYERQLESQRGHPFLITRLLQLLALRPERAAEALDLARQRLQANPQDADALIALSQVHARRGDLSEAAQALKRLAEAADARGDPIEAAQAWRGVAGLLMSHDPKGAAMALEEALALRRALPGAMEALSQLYAAAGNWRGALRILEQQLNADEGQGRGNRAALLCRLGALSLKHAQDPAAAAEYYEQALLEEGDPVEALIGLAQAREAAHQLHPAARALERAAERLRAAGRLREAADMVRRLGDLLRRGLESPAAAKLRYDEALKLDPDNPHALLGLAEIALREDQRLAARGHLQALLRRDAATLEGIEPRRLHLKLGRLLLESPEGEAQGIAHLQKALSGPPIEDDPAEEALARLAEAHSHAGRWGDLSRVLEIAAARAPTPGAAARHLRRRAEVVWRHLNAQDLAERLLLEAKAMAPGDDQLLATLCDLYRAKGDHEALSATLSARVERISDRQALGRLYAEWGALLHGPLRRVEEAAVAYAMALGCDAAHAQALDGLIDIYAEQGRDAERVELLRRRADHPQATPAARVADLKAAATLEAERLGQPLAALRDLEAALTIAPKDVEILERLVQIARYDADPRAALGYASALYALHREGGAQLSRRLLGTLADLAGRLGRLDEALRWLEISAERAPEDEAISLEIEALAGRAVEMGRGDLVEEAAALLMRLSEPLPSAMSAARRLRAARLLYSVEALDEAAAWLDELLDGPEGEAALALRSEIATTQEDWGTRASLLKRGLMSGSAATRPARMTALAELHFTRLRQPQEGIRWAKAALAEAPADGAALRLLSEHAFQLGDWTTAYDASARLSVEAPQDTEAARRAGLSALYLGMYPEAIARLSPADGVLEALRDPARIVGLTEAHLALGDGVALARLLDARLRLPAEDAQLRALAHALADQPEAAARCWRRLLDQTPQDAEAQAKLSAPRSSPALASAPPRGLLSPPSALDYPPPPPKETAHRVTSGRTARHLDDGDEDSQPPRVVFAPEDDALAGDALSGEQGEDIEDHDSADLDTPDGALRRAERERDQRHNPEGSIPLFERVLARAEPKSMAWLEALEALEDLHTIAQRWESLLGLYDLRAEVGLASEEEIRPLKASVWRTLGQHERALAALEGLSTPEALELRVSLHLERGAPRAAAEALLGALEGIDAQAVAHRRWRAADHLVEAGAGVEALAQLQAAYEAHPEEALLEAWLTLAEAQGAGEARAEALIQRAARLDDRPQHRVRASRYLFEAARLLSEVEPRRAVQLHQRALDLWSENVDALLAQATLLETLADQSALAFNLQRQIEVSFTGPSRGRLALRLAQLWIELEDSDEVDPPPGAAVEAAEIAFEEGDEETQAAALALLKALGAREDALGVELSGSLPSASMEEALAVRDERPDDPLDDELLGLMAELGLSDPKDEP
ncbi:hypothetical protein KKF91_18335 [Myxococcota bacterium]|nr:hypothetical protein [Myxococcota bacterium]